MRDSATRDSRIEALCIVVFCLAGMFCSSNIVQTYLPSPETPRMIVRVLGVPFEVRVPL